MRLRERPIGVGIIGMGTVGGGVVKHFQDGRLEDFGLKLRRIAVHDLSKPRKTKFPLTNDVNAIFNDPSIDIVVELMGGLLAKDYILEAINHGKSVVTANKAVMARYAKLLFDTSRSQSVDLGFEASVGGGIRIIDVLNTYKGEKINRIMGILNGTTNYILTQMEEGLSFDAALKRAQKKGFAEADHTLDTGGYDSRDKLALLASLVFNTQIDPEKISCTGIGDITPIDIDFARKYETEEGGRGYVIKLLAVAKRRGNAVELRVNPALIQKDHQLASVSNEVNAVYIEPELAGPQILGGRGAGRNATTSAVISDIIRIAKNIRRGVTDELPTLNEKIDVIDPDKVQTKGYIRTSLKHIPGSGAQALRILGEHGLNVVDSVQRRRFGEIINGKIYIPDIITVEAIEKKFIKSALKELAKSKRTHGPTLFLPFEE